MTSKQFERILRTWQKRLGLDTWDIELDFEQPANDDCNATTWRLNSYDRAKVYLDPVWPTWTRPFANQIACHELLHLLTRDVDICVDSLEGCVSKPVWEQFDSRYDHEIEGLVDRIARRLTEIGGLV